MQVFRVSLFLSLYRPGWYVKILHTLNPHALNRSGLGFIFGATVMQLIRTREQSSFTASVRYVLPLGLNSPDKTTINIRSGRCYTVKNNDTLKPAVFWIVLFLGCLSNGEGNTLRKSKPGSVPDSNKWSWHYSPVGSLYWLTGAGQIAISNWKEKPRKSKSNLFFFSQ